MTPRGLTRRGLLRAGGGALAAGALAQCGPLLSSAQGAVRSPDSLPYPLLPAGVSTGALPFDHIVVVMMENHSFDNYFGMLPQRGQPLADGFTFGANGLPTNSNPLGTGRVTVSRATNTCQPVDITQAWTPVHQEVNGGAMDGFARVDRGQMLYFDESDIPFYYGLAKTFTLANRWFCSAPCQTYPNRRFLMAGTAYGDITTDVDSLSDAPPPNGTIFDRLSAHGISWRNYFTDLPATAIIPSVPSTYSLNLASIGQFFGDCAAGTLPAVSFVDPEFGVGGDVAGSVSQVPGLAAFGNGIATQGGDEENPQNVQYGQAFVASVVNAVLSSPAWPRTLLVWTYDEHGGYYDHVPPPSTIAPDAIPPRLAAGDAPGGFDVYGPRVPTVVVSPYARPGGVSNVVHDHTSILATIEAQWNLPALTFRDANAPTLADFLDVTTPALLTPPTLPAAPIDRALDCDSGDPSLPVAGNGASPTGLGPGGDEDGAAPVAKTVAARATTPHLIARFHGGRHAGRPRALIGLKTNHGVLSGLVLELHAGKRVIARAYVTRVGTHTHHVVLRAVPRHVLKPGHYRLTVTRHGKTLVGRRVRVR